MATTQRARRAPLRSKPAIAASIPEHLFTHRAFRALGVAERWLIVELIARKNRVDKLCRQNRRAPDDVVGCSVREAADMLGLRKSQAADILAGLRSKGFLAEAREPSKGPLRRGTSTGWRLTFLPFRGEPATCEYLKIADRAERQADAERLAGQPFFYAPGDDEVSGPPDSFDPGSVRPTGQVSSTDLLLAA